MKPGQRGKPFPHTPEGRAFLRDAGSRVKAVLVCAKQRVVRQMAERCALAILAGNRIAEVSLEDLPAMKAVEDALCDVLLPVYERGRLEVRAEHERLWGTPADALRLPAGLHAGAKARVGSIAGATAEKYRAHLEGAVKTVAAAIEARGQADPWKRPMDEIADIICTAVMRLGSRPGGRKA